MQFDRSIVLGWTFDPNSLDEVGHSATAAELHQLLTDPEVKCASRARWLAYYRRGRLAAIVVPQAQYVISVAFEDGPLEVRRRGPTPSSA